MDKENKLGTESIIKLLITFSIPAIIGMVVNTLYNIVDRMFIGNIPEVGNLAITGVGVTLPIMTVIMGFGLLIGVGASARINLNLGKGDKDTAENHLGNAVTLILIIGAVITVLGLIFSNQLLMLFGASEDTISYASEYMNIIYIGVIPSLIGFGLNHSIRSDGSPKFAMIATISGAISNIILDYIFIFNLGLGVKGAALATIISQAISASCILWYFYGGKSKMKIRKKYLKLNKTIILSIFTIGMSPFAMQIAQSLVQVVANNSLKEYGGDNAIGAMAIISSIAMIFSMPIIGLNQGAQPIIGYNYGAKQYHRVKKTIAYSIIFATTMGLLVFLLIELSPEVIIRIFNNNEDLLNITINGARIYLFMMPVVGFQIVSSNYFQSIGKAKVSMFLSLLRQVILLIPLMLILPNVFNLGLNGVWLAGPTADFLSAAITGTMFVFAIRELKSDKLIEEKNS